MYKSMAILYNYVCLVFMAVCESLVLQFFPPLPVCFIYYYYTLLQNTEFLLDDKCVLILNETPLSIYRSTILRYC